MGNNTKNTGSRAEATAISYLQKKGYTLLKQNYHYQKGEIDLVMQKDKLLVFVEVKFRSDDSFGMPEEGVSKKQKKLIIMAANQYIFENNWMGNIRFDIVAMLKKSEKLEIAHFEDAFF